MREIEEGEAGVCSSGKWVGGDASQGRSRDEVTSSSAVLNLPNAATFIRFCVVVTLNPKIIFTATSLL